MNRLLKIDLLRSLIIITDEIVEKIINLMVGKSTITYVFDDFFCTYNYKMNFLLCIV